MRGSSLLIKVNDKTNDTTVLHSIVDLPQAATVSLAQTAVRARMNLQHFFFSSPFMAPVAR